MWKGRLTWGEEGAAFLPHSAPAHPRGAQGTTGLTGFALPSLHYSRFHVTKDTVLIYSAGTSCAVLQKELVWHQTAAENFILRCFFAPVSTMQVPGAAFEMGCWNQAAIQRGKTRCWEHQALTG